MAVNTSVSTSAGSTLHIVAAGMQPATYDVAGYSAVGLTYVEVGEITDMGEFGREYALVTHSPVGTRGTVKKKGSFNEGTIALQLGLNTDDAGQIVLKQATLSDLDFTYKITTQNGDVYYFQAQSLSFKVGVGSVDQITMATVNLELTTSKNGVGIVESLTA
jgi:hypothetical protein